MKVESDTFDRLALAARPKLLAAMLWGMGALILVVPLIRPQDMGAAERVLVAVLAIGLLGAAWWFFPMTTTVFDRPGQLVVHEERRLLHTRPLAWPLGRVAGAEVEASWSDGTRLTRLTLRIDGQRVPLETGYGPADRRAVEHAVNDWLSRPPT